MWAGCCAGPDQCGGCDTVLGLGLLFVNGAALHITESAACIPALLGNVSCTASPPRDQLQFRHVCIAASQLKDGQVPTLDSLVAWHCCAFNWTCGGCQAQALNVTSIPGLDIGCGSCKTVYTKAGCSVSKSQAVVSGKRGLLGVHIS